ncbi:hypothetical protein OKW40_002438 [Paraburkholderia sp. RAU6.4a]
MTTDEPANGVSVVSGVSATGASAMNGAGIETTLAIATSGNTAQ